jgi:hypothetical protein
VTRTGGRIESAWDAVDGGFRYAFTVPTGTSATVILPVADGRQTLSVNGIALRAEELGATVSETKWQFEVKAGNYVIV